MPARLAAVLALLLLSLAASAEEIALSEPVHGPAALSQLGASAASDGDGWFVVWADNRSGGGETRATRVTRDGAVLDPTGIVLPVDAIEPVHVVWTGTSYLLVWNKYGPNAVWGLRVDRDGTVIDGPRLLVGDALATSVAANGTHAVIAYEIPVWVPNYRRALFLTPDGVPAATVELAGPREQGARMQIAWNGSHFAAIWWDSGDLSQNKLSVSGVRFDVTGRLDDAPRVLYKDEPSLDISVASDGADFAVVARDHNTDLYYARRVSGDLLTVGPPTVLPDSQGSDARVLWAGSHYVVTGRTWNRILGVRLDRDARPIDGKAAIIENLGDTGSLGVIVAVTNGRDLLVGWTGELVADPNISESDVFGTIVSPSTLAPRTRSLLTVSAPRQIKPLVANGGTNLLAVWHEKTGLYARRLTPDGALLDAEPLRLAARATATAVVFHGSDYIVVWTEPFGKGIVTARVRRDGALRVDGGGRIEASFAQPLAAASDGTTMLLLWHSESGLVATRVGADGAIVDPVPLALFPDHGIGNVAVAPDGAGTFLVVWEEFESIHYPPYESWRHLRGARITRELVNLDTAGIDVVSTTPLEFEPAIAWNGREWLVVWTRWYDGIYGRTVAADGAVVGGEVRLATNAARRPSVTWDGRRYTLAWLEQRTLRSATMSRLGTGLVGTRALAQLAENPGASLVALRNGLVAAAYARIAQEPRAGGVPRAFVNLIGAPPKRRAVR